MLVGSKERPKDQDVERSLPLVKRDVVAAARKPPEAPRKLIKLKSWKEPELVAVSGPLHPEVLQIAVDAGVSPPLVWVANAAGPGSLMQLAGDDLSVKKEWVDSGETLSCPRQSGDQPILNIDPQTGHVYVEDDSNHRLKQFGTVYRIDQEGNVLKKWPSLFFDSRDLKMTSPWGSLELRAPIPLSGGAALHRLHLRKRRPRLPVEIGKGRRGVAPLRPRGETDSFQGHGDERPVRRSPHAGGLLARRLSRHGRRPARQHLLCGQGGRRSEIAARESVRRLAPPGKRVRRGRESEEARPAQAGLRARPPGRRRRQLVRHAPSRQEAVGRISCPVEVRSVRRRTALDPALGRIPGTELG